MKADPVAHLRRMLIRSAQISLGTQNGLWLLMHCHINPTNSSHSSSNTVINTEIHPSTLTTFIIIAADGCIRSQLAQMDENNFFLFLAPKELSVLSTFGSNKPNAVGNGERTQVQAD